MQTAATLNPILSIVASDALINPNGFVADLIAPRFPTPLQAGTYYKFQVDDIINVPDLKPRAPGSPYQRMIQKVASDAFACENYGLEMPAPDEERRKYANYFDLDKVKVNRGITTIKINREKRVVKLLAALPAAAIAVPWNDPGSNPKADIEAATTVIRQNSGISKAMLTLTISEPTFLALQTHPKLTDLFKYTTPGVMNEQKMASYFGLRRVVVSYNVQAINHEGQAFSAADIWGNNASLTMDVDQNDLETPCTLRTLNWTAFTSQVSTLDSGTAASAGNGGGEQSIFTYRDETVKADIHRAEHYVSEKLIAAATGYLLNGCLG